MPRYRAPAAELLRVAPLDDLTAVFHRASGRTHLVVSPVPELLAELAGAWRTPAGLLERLAARYEMPDSDLSALVERLDELVGTGLVERA